MRKPIIAMLFAAAAITSNPASAGTATFTFEGIILEGYDGAGIFGTAKSDLSGKHFTSIYTVNYPTHGAFFNTDGRTYISYQGGRTYNNGVDLLDSQSPVSATFAIGQTVYEIPGQFRGGVAKYNEYVGYFNAVDGGADDLILTDDNLIENTVYDSFNFGEEIVNPLNLFQYIIFTDSQNFERTGYFRAGPYLSPEDPSLTWAELADRSVTVTADFELPPPSAVPEPASWALMIGGFGLIGGALRQRRSSQGRASARTLRKLHA